MAIDFDNEKKKYGSVNKRLQDYAEKIAQLEVRYVQALSLALPAESVDADGRLRANKNESSVGIKVDDIYGALLPGDDDEQVIEESRSQNPSRSNSFSVSMSHGHGNIPPSFITEVLIYN
jgi:hypothetical protein